MATPLRYCKIRIEMDFTSLHPKTAQFLYNGLPLLGRNVEYALDKSSNKSRATFKKQLKDHDIPFTETILDTDGNVFSIYPLPQHLREMALKLADQPQGPRYEFQTLLSLGFAQPHPTTPEMVTISPRGLGLINRINTPSYPVKFLLQEGIDIQGLSSDQIKDIYHEKNT